MAPPTLRAPCASSRLFGHLPDGRAVHEHTLDNGRGLVLRAINLGGIVTGLSWPDRAGHGANVVLGFDNLADYALRNPHFGTLVGRYANRIRGGCFTLDGQVHQLARNDSVSEGGPHPANSLHGGPAGFGTRWWAIEAEPARPDGSISLALSLASEDGDEHYPGRLEVKVRYTLTADDAWRVDYAATTDRATVVNLTHHGYFNLAGGGSVLDHVLTLHASRYLPVDAQFIPGEPAPVAGTPFDFRGGMALGRQIRCGAPQLLIGRGYDHCLVLDRDGRDGRDGLVEAGVLHDPASGRTMRLETTEPGVQLYTANYLDGRLRGGNGLALRQGDGVCLETQHFPDSPNRPDFPSTVLRPGATFQSTTVHRFSID